MFREERYKLLRNIVRNMAGKHARCSECGTKVKLELAEKEDNEWVKTEDGWLGPNCNPDTDTSW